MRFIFKAGIGHRLPAAGLVDGIVHVYSQTFQKLEGGHPHLRIYSIDVTRNKQPYFHTHIISYYESQRPKPSTADPFRYYLRTNLHRIIENEK